MEHRWAVHEPGAFWNGSRPCHSGFLFFHAKSHAAQVFIIGPFVHWFVGLNRKNRFGCVFPVYKIGWL
jgi:hypothetical protein